MALPGSKLCDAMSKRSGQRCQAPAVTGSSKCRIHGGKSTGPKNPEQNKGNTNFGIYSKFLKPHELTLEFQIGTVDAELHLMRLQLTRVLQQESEWTESVLKGEDVSETTMDLVEVVREEGDRVVGENVMPISSIRKVRRRPDFEAMRTRCIARIESLEKTRKELLGDGGDQTLKDKAEKLKTFIDEMDDSVPETEPE
jgi:hypothetical protein